MKQSIPHHVFYRAMVVWILFVPVAFINGTLRELVYKPYTGELVAHQISTILACVAFFCLAYWLLATHVIALSKWKLFAIGFLWLVLTILFEFGLGRLTGAPTAKLLHDYNLTEGRIWMLLLLTVLLTPLWIQQLHLRKPEV